MWILLWFVLSAILIGFTLWSLQILIKQKKAWETYAKSKSLTFNRGKMMSNAEMSGAVGDYRLSFFTAERASEDVRTRKYVTVLEINIIEGLVDGGVAGTPIMLPFMQSLEKLHPFKPEITGWESDLSMFIRNDNAVKAYMTPERGEAFLSILKTKNADVLIVFNDREFVVRLETSDPMQNADKIDKIVKRMTGLMDKLRITEAQRAAYTAATATAVTVAAQPSST